MNMIRQGSLRSGWRRVWPAALLLAVAGGVDAAAPPLRNLAEVKMLAGNVVAEARMGRAETALRLRGFRVRQVALPAPQRVTIHGQAVSVESGFHVTVFFDQPLTVRSQALSLVVDGEWCGVLQEAPDLRSADTVCFDATLVRSGAAVGVTYRTITIGQPRDLEASLSPDARLEAGEEPVHYLSARLQLRTR